MTWDTPVSRLLVACLMFGACGAPATRPTPTLGHAITAPRAAPVETPSVATAPIEVEPPSWLEPTKPTRRVVTSTSITILDQIAFVGSSALIDPTSYPMLDAVVATLDGNPSIRVMEVIASGRDAPDGWRQVLGDRRARMMMEYMISKGADRARLRSRGEAAAPQISSFLILQRD
jgi:outer membrane protein OmpA-like peptidoglycan-associated protein